MSQDQSSADNRTSPQPSSFLQDQQTRRRFLKAAVASGAMVAAVGAMGATVSASPRALRQLRGQQAMASGQPNTWMCIEDSAFNPITAFTVNSDGTTNPGTLFVWFVVHIDPFDALQDIFNFTLTPAPGDGTAPFKLNEVYPILYQGSPILPEGYEVFTSFPGYSPTAWPLPCPVGNPAGYSKGFIGHGISNVFPFNVADHIGTGASDIYYMARVQIQYNNGPVTSDTPYTFAVTFTVSGATHPTYTYTGQATVTAKTA